ncbi:MAG: hypothetical protein MUF40_06945, partial [Gemmatimonadaceae bacterium]|nr:hypothetical protein [Gemmatimonadaceae bacterium]
MSFRRSLAVASLGLIAAGAPLAAQSTTLVAPLSNACLSAGFGNTSFLSFEYAVTAGFGSFAQLGGVNPPCVQGWPSG